MVLEEYGNGTVATHTFGVEQFTGSNANSSQTPNTNGNTTTGYDQGNIDNNNASLSMSGEVRYELNGPVMTFDVETISNVGSTNSGTLSLSLWATDGESIIGEGYNLGELTLGELATFTSMNNINQQTALSLPPDGTHFMHMLLKEDNHGGLRQLSARRFVSSQIGSGTANISHRHKQQR